MRRGIPKEAVRNMPQAIILFSATLLIFLSGCAGLSGKAHLLAKREAAKTRSEYEQFQGLCSSDSRSKIYKSVFANGYISTRTSGNDCNGGWDILVEQGYEYFECATGKTIHRDSLIQGDIYRLEIREGSGPDCISWNAVSKDLFVDKKAQEHKRKHQEKCLVRSKVSQAKSRYLKLFEFGRVTNEGVHELEFPNDPEKKNLISYRGVQIIDLHTNKTLSIDRDYKYWPEGITNKAVGKYTCEEERYVDEANVLIPK